MADTYEQNLSQKGTLTVSDYIRVVGSDNASYKQLVSDVAKKIIENYTGSSLAGSSQSVKSALDALNSNTKFGTTAAGDAFTLNCEAEHIYLVVFHHPYMAGVRGLYSVTRHQNSVNVFEIKVASELTITTTGSSAVFTPSTSPLWYAYIDFHR